MHIVQYKIDPLAKTVFADIAYLYNINVATLAQCNNCYNNIPIYAQENTNIKKQGYVNVPIPNNGNIDNSSNTGWYVKSVEDNHYTKQSSLLTGTGSDVILIINDNVINMPCYPTTISDSLSVDYTSNAIPYRTEPYLNYSNSGPRTVSVSFNLHREMTESDGSDIDTIINTIQAASYPKTGNSNAISTSLKIGNHIYIRGVITGGINTSYSGPIIDGKYNVCDISFSITEVTGDMIYFNNKLKKGSYMD